MPRATPHYEAALDRDLADLRVQLQRMTALVLRSLTEAGRALRERDRRAAYRVILDDNRVDALESRIDRMCQEFLVRHMPAGAPLRFVLATIKVNAELERMGDYAETIAHRAVTLHGEAEIPVAAGLDKMFERAGAMLSTAMDAFIHGDAAKATAALEMERGVDELNRAVFEELSRAGKGERNLSKRFAVLGILNRLERVADRAVNIAEDAMWATRGEVWRHGPRREYKVLFISPADATLGPMAEAVARAQAPLQVGFASAGITPAPLNPVMVSYMQRHGFEVSRPFARGLSDVGKLEDYYVVVTLSLEAEAMCPPLPYRTIQLFWDIPDPSAATGTPAEIEAVYDRVLNELQAKTADLTDAILGANPESDGA